MSTSHSSNNWISDTKRSDGLYVHNQIGNGWAIRTKNGKTITHCPCCDLLLATRRIARLVADKEFPVEATQ